MLRHAEISKSVESNETRNVVAYRTIIWSTSTTRAGNRQSKTLFASLVEIRNRLGRVNPFAVTPRVASVWIPTNTRNNHSAANSQRSRDTHIGARVLRRQWEGIRCLCIPLCITDQADLTSVHLMCSKSQVAPLKSQTLPRLELCATVLLTKQYCGPIQWLCQHWIRTTPT